MKAGPRASASGETTQYRARGSKPKAETQLCGLGSARARCGSPHTPSAALGHQRKQSLELELEAKRRAVQHAQKEKVAAENQR